MDVLVRSEENRTSVNEVRGNLDPFIDNKGDN